MAGVGKLLKQAQKMQKRIEEAQAELANTTVEVAHGGGAVKIVINDPGDEKHGGTYLEFVGFEWNKKLDEKLFIIPEDFTFKGLEEPRKEPTAKSG